MHEEKSETHEEEHVHEEESETHEEEHAESHEEGHHHTGENAHAWMDTVRYAQMVRNIAASMSAADPEHADSYQENARQYCEKIQKLTDQLAELKETIAGKPVVILHEAYAYVAEELGMENVCCLNLDEERQVSAHEVADVVEEISMHQIPAVFAEELYGKDMGNTLETETDATVYYLDTLVRGEYEADSYLKGMQKNIEVLKQAFQQK